MLENAIQQVDAWRRGIAGQEQLWVSINISAFQLPSQLNVAAMTQILTTSTAQSVPVVLEVTELALSPDVQGGIAALTELRASGARIAIDDFGTGYSSLGTLTRLPLDILKIDRSFISGHDEGVRSRPVLEGILDLSLRLGLDLIAEGIEEPAQLALLQRLGCPLGQGLMLAPPTNAEHVAELLGIGALWLAADTAATADL